MLKLVNSPKNADSETFQSIIKYLEDAASFIAISIGSDGRRREHYFKITPEQRIYLCELAKQSAIDDFQGR